MATENKSNKIITIVLAVIITIAAITVLYVSLPQNKENNTSGGTNEQQGGGNQTESVVLTIIYGDEQTNYTLQQLENLTPYTGYGGYIKLGMLPDIVIDGPFNYTGVEITTLLNDAFNLPVNYTITVKATDNKTTDYNLSQMQGDVDIYNESGVANETGGVTMILAYKIEEEYLKDTSDGPFRIAFVNNGRITSSRLWTKMVNSIEINELP